MTRYLQCMALLGFAILSPRWILVQGDTGAAHEQPPTRPWMPTPSNFPRSLGQRARVTLFTGRTAASRSTRTGAVATSSATRPTSRRSPWIRPTRKIVIGWRQFDTVESDFRQAGWAYSHDGGHTWVFPGSVTPGVFGTDPVLAAGPTGEIYYLSINFDGMRLFSSFDGAVTWATRVQVSPGFLDKPWMTVDTTCYGGRGNIYIANDESFFRSTDGGATFFGGHVRDWVHFPAMHVDSSGSLLVTGVEGCLYVSYSVQNASELAIFFKYGCAPARTLEVLAHWLRVRTTLGSWVSLGLKPIRIQSAGRMRCI